METRFSFRGDTTVSLSFNEDVTDHADIDIIIDNNDENGDPGIGYLHLKEHEAEYLAHAILRFVEQNRRDNERWKEDEAKRLP